MFWLSVFLQWFYLGMIYSLSVAVAVSLFVLIAHKMFHLRSNRFSGLNNASICSI